MISGKTLLRFWQQLGIAGMMMLSQSLLAAEQQPANITDIQADNLPQFVSQLSNDYYQQLESLVTYYQLYQQKRDPRGFNVWHLRGFSPAFKEQQTYYQNLLATASAETQPTAEKLVAIFNALDTISTQLMISFRENDPVAYQQAQALVSDNNALLAAQLKQFALEAEIREINLN